jgi:hypothetical protein
VDEGQASTDQLGNFGLVAPGSGQLNLKLEVEFAKLAIEGHQKDQIDKQ